MSAALKLTPWHLGHPKIKLDMAGRTYSHETQCAVNKGGVVYMITYNATQTYNYKGQANDSDNDK